MSVRCKQQGQAMMEMAIVAAGAVGFLLLFIPLMTKVSEAKTKTMQSARYAAWERTIYYEKKPWDTNLGAEKPFKALREESNARNLAKAQDAIGLKYDKQVPLDPFLFFLNRNMTVSKYEEFIVDQKTGTTLPQYLTVRETVSEAPLGIPFGGKAFQLMNLPNLPTDGLYRSYAMTETKSLGWWKEFDDVIAPYNTNVILADGWSPGLGVVMQAKMKEGVFTKANNTIIKPFNAIADVLSAACIGVGIKCGRDLKKDRLSETSTSPQYVPAQRLEGYKGK